ncbi:hypothetical protein K502DRAFT_91719 [Neoconidiobolus thromboides FSU 785]|nr:hypothetical protein K502DRAFT_91719 [Neoconidiobolus thromboides FSU 785]
MASELENQVNANEKEIKGDSIEPQQHIKLLLENSKKRALALFPENKQVIDTKLEDIPASQKIKLSVKIKDEYHNLKQLPKSLTKQQNKVDQDKVAGKLISY